MRDLTLPYLVAVALLVSANAHAQPVGVYHPYVNQGEREIEYGLSWREVDGRALTFQRASFAYSWTENLSTELYVLSEFSSHDQLRGRAQEIEIKWQLTEQGEFSSDWGLIFEAELGDDPKGGEVAAGLLWEKELGHRLVAAANALVEYEFGAEVENEFETAFRGQLRYLHRPSFEPAVEIYLDDLDYAAGPALLGARRLSPGKQVLWEVGALFGIDGETPSSLRVKLEFEF